MIRKCAWCGREMGTCDGEGVTHSICPPCAERELANWEMVNREIEEEIGHGERKTEERAAGGA